MGACEDAAEFALKSVKIPAEYNKLCNMLCWDAIMYCAQKGGVANANKYQLGVFEPRIPAALAPACKPSKDLSAAGAGAMANLQPGHAIVFYEDKVYRAKITDTVGEHKLTPVHAMISIGKGQAFGVRNECIELLMGGGWEIVDLAKDHRVKWGNGQFEVTAQGGKKVLKVWSRPIDQIT